MSFPTSPIPLPEPSWSSLQPQAQGRSSPSIIFLGKPLDHRGSPVHCLRALLARRFLLALSVVVLAPPLGSRGNMSVLPSSERAWRKTSIASPLPLLSLRPSPLTFFGQFCLQAPAPLQCCLCSGLTFPKSHSYLWQLPATPAAKGSR